MVQAPDHQPALVILTGASGAGKTTLARAIAQQQLPACKVLCFDTIGVPSAEIMRTYGSGYQPGGAWQRAMTLRWMERIAGHLHKKSSVLFEGQMRIAFVQEALQMYGIEGARILLVDCDDATRTRRLHEDRGQPELAHEHMMHWASYLREEAQRAGCDILDTGRTPLRECSDRIATMLIK